MKITTSFGEYIIGGIYEHYEGKYFKIDLVGFLHRSSNVFLIAYHQCDVNGIYISIRENIGQQNEKIVHQPFITHETEWFEEVHLNGIKRKRFELIK